MKPTGNFKEIKYTCVDCGEEKIGHSKLRKRCFQCMQDKKVRLTREHMKRNSVTI